MPEITAWDAYQFGLLPLVVYREARNQTDDAMAAVAWVIKNRVRHPGWWGTDYPSVILKHYQFSSFNWNDPNSQRYLTQGSLTDRILRVCHAVYFDLLPDPTSGATYYFDKSLDKNPPKWAKDMTHTADIGDFHFYRE